MLGAPLSQFSYSPLPPHTINLNLNLRQKFFFILIQICVFFCETYIDVYKSFLKFYNENPFILYVFLSCTKLIRMSQGFFMMEFVRVSSQIFIKFVDNLARNYMFELRYRLLKIYHY